MDLIDKNILVTGSSGFIGKELCKKLKELNANVIEYDLKNGQDILNLYQLKSFIELYNPDIIFHLAAQSQVVVSSNHPKNTLTTNIEGTINVLECGRLNNTPKIIIASSDKAYGEKDKEYDVSMELGAIYPYDVSKLCADKISNSYMKVYNMDISISRFANIYGFGDYNWQRLIPGVIRDCIRGRNPVLRSDGLMTRDFIYIKDCVDGYIKLINSKPGVWNFAGENSSVINIVKMITKYFNNIEPTILNIAKNEIKNQKLDDEYTRDNLNWNRKTSLKEGIDKTVYMYKMYKENLSEFI